MMATETKCAGTVEARVEIGVYFTINTKGEPMNITSDIDELLEKALVAFDADEITEYYCDECGDLTKEQALAHNN